MGPLHRILDGVLRKLEDAAAVLAACIMFGAMVLASADALMRYAFDAPIRIQHYLTENYLLLAMVVLPMAWGFRTGGYIRLDVLQGILPARAYVLLLRIGLVLSALFIGVLGWTAGGRFLQTWRGGEVHMGVIDWPVAWSWFWIPVGCGLLACRLAMTALGPAERVQFRQDVLE